MASTSRTTLDFFSPLFFPLISLIVSITLCFHFISQKISLGGCFLFWLILITGIIATKNSRFFQGALLSLCIATGGWVRTTLIFERFNHFPFDNPLTSLHGLVTAQSIATKSRMKHCLTLSLVRIDNHPLSVPYTIQLYTPTQLEVQIGDTIEINNITLKKAKNSDFNKYLLKEGIVATVFTEQINYKLIERPPYCIARWIFNQRDRILRAFKSRLSTPTFALFSSLFLGEKETSRHAIETIQKYFKQWGILHYLARSGLHLVIVLSVYEFLFRLLPISFVYKHLLLLLLNIIYFLLSWPSVSFLRAFLIFLLYKLFSLFYIPTHFLHILYLTCIIILLVNPLQLFFLDFQLSFGFTFALGWLNQYKVDPKA